MKKNIKGSLIQIKIFLNDVQKIEDEINAFLFNKKLVRDKIELEIIIQNSIEKTALAILYYTENNPACK